MGLPADCHKKVDLFDRILRPGELLLKFFKGFGHDGYDGWINEARCDGNSSQTVGKTQLASADSTQIVEAVWDILRKNFGATV